ncbi:putative phage baseplate assembly protein [Mitsuaria sp. BK045]|uniref:putative baseplate assembly protein n=1 Tax=unclassified Roseateles TaxID=2626991 RepID=UPI00161EE958|nr:MULTISPECIES: putative baseplate assembly protein [unclassified Roseateles]MBB3293355.1 putative phage baseplate assembly protein [Mitsuaria sp. BK041]MBB3362572.1 putative phage baseplate assembly protein [Mitsuaria sp. BK045]
MSIPLPQLDDRRWSDLVEQGRALIPLVAPAWTDHNASDPGITLMELLASVAETDLYRLNRFTDAQKRRLLALMDIRCAPPRPATLVSELRIAAGPSPVASPVVLPAGTEFDGMRLDATAAPLRTTAPIEVVDAVLRAVQRQDAAGFQNLTAAWSRQETFAAFGDDPAVGAECQIGFDRALPAGRWSQVFVCIEGDQARLSERARLAEEAPIDAPLVHHGARLVWEYFADDGAAGRWLPLEVDDDTRSFSLNGALRLRPGAAMKASVLGRVAQPQCWVRARLVDGAFDAAPRLRRLLLNGVQLEQSTPVWTSWPIAPGTVVTGGPITPGQGAALRLTLQQGRVVALSVDASGEAPVFTVLAYTAASATDPGLLAVDGTLAGTGSGEPSQRLTLAQRPVVEASLRLFSVEDGHPRAWTRVDDFSASSRSDAHFTLDPTSGEVVGGDGERGRVLPRGCQVFAFHAWTRPAPAVARIDGLADSPRNRVFLPDAGAIGRIAAGVPIVLEDAAPAETLAHALGRAIEQREARLRAVTREDFEALALATPGLRVARAIALPNFCPGLACVNAPGMVTVIVLPFLPLGRPFPSRGVLDRVAARLETRRVLGTRVVVAGPGYLEVAVRARVQALDGIDRQRLATEVSAALDGFFDPVSGGPDAAGWPLGRDVYRAEVMQVIDQTPGVDHVIALELIAEGCAPNCGNVCLRPDWLVAAGRHNIEVA